MPEPHHFYSTAEDFDLLPWYSAIVRESGRKDWRQGIQDEYRKFTEQSAFKVRLALLRIAAAAPTGLGEAIRSAIINPHASPTHEGGRSRDLLPLPLSMDIVEAMIPPTSGCSCEPYISHHRAFCLLKVLVLNF